MDNLYTLAVILVIAWIILFYLVASPRRSGRVGPRHLYRTSLPPKNFPAFDITDVGQQLGAVMAAPFERRQLLNWSEYQTFKIIENDVAAMQQGYRVYPQTSLGEILYSADTNAFRSINSKRVDMLIVDRAGWPIHGCRISRTRALPRQRSCSRRGQEGSTPEGRRPVPRDLRKPQRRANPVTLTGGTRWAPGRADDEGHPRDRLSAVRRSGSRNRCWPIPAIGNSRGPIYRQQN